MAANATLFPDQLPIDDLHQLVLVILADRDPHLPYGDLITRQRPDLADSHDIGLVNAQKLLILSCSMSLSGCIIRSTNGWSPNNRNLESS
jgi:hypothetical protein